MGEECEGNLLATMYTSFAIMSETGARDISQEGDKPSARTASELARVARGEWNVNQVAHRQEEGGSECWRAQQKGATTYHMEL